MKIPLPKNFQPQKPLTINDYQDLIVTIYCSQIQPQQFSFEKLKEKNIISLDEKLSKPIIKRNNLLQLIFDSGIVISIELGRISFYSKINKNIGNLVDLIQKFTQIYNKYNWQKIRLTFKRFLSFPNTGKKGSKFFPDEFINSNLSWNVEGKSPSQVQLNFFYNFPNHPLLLSINQIVVKLKNKSRQGLLFKGIFNYNLREKKSIEKISFLNSIVLHYENNLTIFNKIIDQNILS